MAKPSNTVTLFLSGKPELGDLARAVAGFAALIDALAAKENPQGPIHWKVSGLEAGSASATAEGVADIPQDLWVVKQIAKEYTAVGRATREGILKRHYKGKVVSSVESILGVLNGRVPFVRFENEDDDVEVFACPSAPTATPTLAPSPTGEGVPAECPVPLNVEGAPEISRGEVVGRVQAMSNRTGLRFTLYDRIDEHAISCYLTAAPEAEKALLGVWGQMVSVEGLVKRDPTTGRAATVRQIARIEPLHTSGVSIWELKGLTPRAPSEDLPERIIRRMRDG